MIPFILLAVGFLLIFFEFYLPGGIMGAAGGVVVLISIIVFALESDSLVETLLFFVGAVVGLVLLFRFALWKIRRAKPGHSIYSEGDQEGYIASSFDTTAVGKKGVVSSDLRPGGHVLVDGKRYGAISQSGYITKGIEVDIIGGQGESLIVKEHKKDMSS